VAALDGYRARWLSTLALQRPLRLVIVTNGEATRQAQSAAAGPDVEIITAKQLCRLLAATCCTYYDVLALELTFRTPSDTDPRIFQGAFLAQQCPAVLCFRRMRGDEPSAFPPGE